MRITLEPTIIAKVKCLLYPLLIQGKLAKSTSPTFLLGLDIIYFFTPDIPASANKLAFKQ